MLWQALHVALLTGPCNASESTAGCQAATACNRSICSQLCTFRHVIVHAIVPEPSDHAVKGLKVHHKGKHPV